MKPEEPKAKGVVFERAYDEAMFAHSDYLDVDGPKLLTWLCSKSKVVL